MLALTDLFMIICSFHPDPALKSGKFWTLQAWQLQPDARSEIECDRCELALCEHIGFTDLKILTAFDCIVCVALKPIWPHLETMNINIAFSSNCFCREKSQCTGQVETVQFGIFGFRFQTGNTTISSGSAFLIQRRKYQGKSCATFERSDLAF